MVHEEVFKFDISVHDVVCFETEEGVSDVCEVLHCLEFWEASVGLFSLVFEEVSSGAVVHDQEEV